MILNICRRAWKDIGCRFPNVRGYGIFIRPWRRITLRGWPQRRSVKWRCNTCLAKAKAMMSSKNSSRSWIACGKNDLHTHGIRAVENLLTIHRRFSPCLVSPPGFHSSPAILVSRQSPHFFIIFRLLFLVLSSSGLTRRSREEKSIYYKDFSTPGFPFSREWKKKKNGNDNRKKMGNDNSEKPKMTIEKNRNWTGS